MFTTLKKLGIQIRHMEYDKIQCCINISWYFPFKVVFYKKNKLQKLLVFFCFLQLGNEHGPAGTGRGDVGKPT
jgi:hypothetical protein